MKTSFYGGFFERQNMALIVIKFLPEITIKKC